MSALRIRVAKLSPDFGVGNEFQFALQLSGDSLVWWTVGRFKDLDGALGAGKELAAFVEANFTVRPTHILWTSKL